MLRLQNMTRCRRTSTAPGRSSAGFTLIEILMVVVILGIASAVIVPQIGTRNDLKVSAAARMVMADLIYAQNRSIASQQMHCVKFEAADERYGVVTLADTSQYITHPISKDSYRQSFGSTSGLEDVAIDTVSFDGQAIIGFDELGTPYAVGADGTAEALSAAGTIVIKGGEYSLTIAVEPFTGEITLP